jgi:repressor of nif and glnA expression
VAAVVEEGLEVDNKAMSTVMEYGKLRDIETL